MPQGQRRSRLAVPTLLQIKPQLIFVSSLSFLLPLDALADHFLVHPNCIHTVSLSPEVVSVVRPPAKVLVFLENPYRPLLAKPKNRYRAQRTRFSQAPMKPACPPHTYDCRIDFSLSLDSSGNRTNKPRFRYTYKYTYIYRSIVPEGGWGQIILAVFRKTSPPTLP